MKYQSCKISLQEVPGEISLVFLISECPHRCPGCHSPELWTNKGTLLTIEKLQLEMKRYDDLFTCVCFFGGESAEDALIALLSAVRISGYKTCLYSGAESISSKLKEYLNYLKTGPWKEDLGGLYATTTNQRFINLDTGKCLNYLFQHTQGVTSHA